MLSVNNHSKDANKEVYTDTDNDSKVKIITDISVKVPWARYY